MNRNEICGQGRIKMWWVIGCFSHCPLSPQLSKLQRSLLLVRAHSRPSVPFLCIVLEVCIRMLCQQHDHSHVRVESGKNDANAHCCSNSTSPSFSIAAIKLDEDIVLKQVTREKHLPSNCFLHEETSEWCVLHDFSSTIFCNIQHYLLFSPWNSVCY